MSTLPRSIKINNLIAQANQAGRICPAQVIYGNERGLMVCRADLRGYLVIEIQSGGLPQFPGVTIGQWDIHTGQWVKRNGAGDRLRAWVPEAQRSLGLIQEKRQILPATDPGSIEDELGYEVSPQRESNAQRILRQAREVNERGQAALTYAMQHQGDLGRGNAAARMNGWDF